MSKADLPVICDLENQCFADPWNEANFLYEIEGNPFSLPIVLEKEGQIAGYAILWITFEQAQICNIAAAPAWRQQHIGTQLMNAMLEAAQEAGCETLSLEVRASNIPAQNLYKKFGFNEMRRIRQYYGDGEDAIVMMRGI